MKTRIFSALALVAALVVAMVSSAFAQTPVPIALGTAVPLASSDISGALTAFFAIGPVLGILALVIGLRLAPQIMSALRSLGARR